MRTITSANSSIMLAIPGIYPTPVALQGYAADDAFEADSVQPTETVMGVDGKLSIGYVSHVTKMKIKLQADSESAAIFDQWYQAQQTTRDAYFAQAVITIPGIGKSYVCTNGALTGYRPMPPGKKTLKELDYEITWEAMNGAEV